MRIVQILAAFLIPIAAVVLVLTFSGDRQGRRRSACMRRAARTRQSSTGR